MTEDALTERKVAVVFLREAVLAAVGLMIAHGTHPSLKEHRLQPESESSQCKTYSFRTWPNLMDPHRLKSATKLPWLRST